jgi:hypothetical protein
VREHLVDACWAYPNPIQNPMTLLFYSTYRQFIVVRTRPEKCGNSYINTSSISQPWKSLGMPSREDLRKAGILTAQVKTRSLEKRMTINIPTPNKTNRLGYTHPIPAELLCVSGWMGPHNLRHPHRAVHDAAIYASGDHLDLGCYSPQTIQDQVRGASNRSTATRVLVTTGARRWAHWQTTEGIPGAE